MSRKSSYMFTNKNYSKKSIMSTVLGALSLASIGAAIYFTYLQKGYANISYGLTGILSLLFAICGMVLGVMSTFEKDKFYVFTYIGIGVNLVALLTIGYILYAGVYGI